MASYIHTMILPDGTTAKRTSQSRIYTHAVVVSHQLPDGTVKHYVECWNGNEQLAQRSAMSLRSRLAAWVASADRDEYAAKWGKLLAVQAMPVTEMSEHHPKPRAKKEVVQ